MTIAKAKADPHPAWGESWRISEFMRTLPEPQNWLYDSQDGHRYSDEEQRHHLESMLAYRAKHPAPRRNYDEAHAERVIAFKVRFLPQVSTADDYAKVQPGRAYVTLKDGQIRWKPRP